MVDSAWGNAGGGYLLGAESGKWRRGAVRGGSHVGAEGCPTTGDGRWAFFGGTTAAETASLTQSFTLFPGPATLSFFAWTSAAGGNGQDRFRILVDDAEVALLSEGDARYSGGYRPLEVDLASFADGVSHQLRLEAATAGTPGISNFFVDEVAINACPDLSVPPELWIADRTVVEGDADSELVLTVRLSHPWSQEVSVAYTTVDATAAAGIDYQHRAATLTLLPPLNVPDILQLRGKGRLVLGPESTVEEAGTPDGCTPDRGTPDDGTPDGAPASGTPDWERLCAWDPAALLERLRGHDPSPLDLDVDLQEEVCLRDWRLGEREPGKFGDRLAFPLRVGGLELTAVAADGPEGEALIAALERLRRRFHPADRRPPLFGLLHYELGRVVLQPLALIEGEHPQQLMLSKDKTGTRELLKLLDFS